jgi:hypothetical protein
VRAGRMKKPQTANLSGLPFHRRTTIIDKRKDDARF